MKGDRGMLLSLGSMTTTPTRSIVLHTRQATDIPNSQALEPDPQCIAVFNKLLQQHPNWLVRKPPCGVYNCAGHIWASRRTAVYESDDFKRILADDQYRQLSHIQPLHLGDIAVYKIQHSSSIVHVGLLAELRVPNWGISNGQPIPWVLSKWNDSGGEILHHVNDTPKSLGTLELEWWTDRV